MKKRMFLFGILFLILIIPFAFAAVNDTGLSDTQKVNQAYECLKNKTEEKECDNLGFEEKVFALLAIGECEDELWEVSDSEECWPDGGCTIKATAQAILALDRAGEDVDDAEEWLLNQKTSPSEIVWYLQIESPEATTCKISYDDRDYSITINEEKQIASSAGSCLTLSEGDWWLRVAPSCYGKEIEISCDERFLTNLLFRQQTSSTIHVSEKTTESSANGINTEIVESFCFGQSGKCNYEGSLWAAMVLNYIGNDVNSYMPYLVTLSEDSANSKFIPESFLYTLTDSYDFRNSLLAKQKADKYWDESGDRFYDTALALLPIKDNEAEQKEDSKAWLLDNKTRDSEGCWKGSISATGFILYSLWPRAHSSDSTGIGGDVSVVICASKSGFCLSSIACSETGGTKLGEYYCPGTSVCCSKNKILDTCFVQGGELCDFDETCSGEPVDSSDSTMENICCVEGECTIYLAESECVAASGVCKMSCSDNEQEITHSCDYYGDLCCVVKESSTPTSKNYLWVWVLSLGILIVLLVIGFLYKDKLRAYWIAFKSKGKGKSPPGPRGPFSFSPPPFSNFPQRGIPPRRVIPPSNAPPRKPFSPRPAGDMEEVLKKLKEMGK
ncbi:MAG: hypothetical protein ABIH28_03385 [archaeon]